MSEYINLTLENIDDEHISNTILNGNSFDKLIK